MSLFSRVRRTSYCAFCKSPRRIYRKKHVSLTNVLAATCAAMALSGLFWDGPDPRGLLPFSVFVVVAEIFIYLRWRASLVCRMCGFDPIVYKRSPLQASRQVREFFDRMGEDPQLMLSKSPLVDLHRKHRESARKRAEIEAVRARTERSRAGRGAAAVIDPKVNENPRDNSDLQRA